MFQDSDGTTKPYSPVDGDNVNEETNYVIQRMAAERGITSTQMQGIIEEAIHTIAIIKNSAVHS